MHVFGLQEEDEKSTQKGPCCCHLVILHFLKIPYFSHVLLCASIYSVSWGNHILFDSEDIHHFSLCSFLSLKTFAFWVSPICSKGIRRHVVTFLAVSVKCDKHATTRLIPPTSSRDVTKVFWEVFFFKLSMNTFGTYFEGFVKIFSIQTKWV